jgi:hypothetical protein
MWSSETIQLKTYDDKLTSTNLFTLSSFTIIYNLKKSYDFYVSYVIFYIFYV